MGKDLTDIAVLLVGVALVALLVLNAGGTSAIIDTGTSGFANLLSTVEGTNNFGISAINSGMNMALPGGMIP